MQNRHCVHPKSQQPTQCVSIIGATRYLQWWNMRQGSCSLQICLLEATLSQVKSKGLFSFLFLESMFFGVCKCEELRKFSSVRLCPKLIYSLTSCLLLTSSSPSLVWGESVSFGLFLLCHVIYWEWEPSTLFTAFCVAMAMVDEAHVSRLAKCNFNCFNKCTLKIYSEG